MSKAGRCPFRRGAAAALWYRVQRLAEGRSLDDGVLAANKLLTIARRKELNGIVQSRRRLKKTKGKEK